MSEQELDVLHAVEEIKALPGLVWFGSRPPGLDGVQALFRFENNWGVSMIKGFGSYGIEAMVHAYYEGSAPSGDAFVDYQQDVGNCSDLREDHWAYELASDVHGWLNAATLLELLSKVQALPSLHLLRPMEPIEVRETLEAVTARVSIVDGDIKEAEVR